MFENEVQTRCAICGTGILLGLVLVLAHLPIILLIGPVAILFLGIVADPEETHAVWYGMLNTLGIFDLSALTDIERLTYAEKRHYFWFGEVEMAAMLAGTFAVPLGIFLAGRTEITPCVHRRCGPVPAALCVPAEADPAGDEGGYGCGDRGVREERAGEESLLDLLHRDGRAGPGPGRGPGDSSADCRDDYGDGRMRWIPHPFAFFLNSVFIKKSVGIITTPLKILMWL